MKRPSAFTLIETVLALALSSGLMLVLFSLVNSTATYQVTGNQLVLAAQRRLGLLHDLRFDIGLAQVDPLWYRRETRVLDAAQAFEESLANGLAPQFQIDSREAIVHANRLVGDNRYLLISTGILNPRFDSTASMAGRSATPQCAMNQIVWAHPREFPLTIPAFDSNGVSVNRNLVKPMAGGVVRLRLNGQSNESSAASCEAFSHLDAIEFRYFDGQTWLNSWNSSRKRALPRAVEIKLREAGSDRIDLVVIKVVAGQNSRPSTHSQPGDAL